MTQNTVWRPSPNFGPRRNKTKPQLILLHYTAMKDAQSALERLCDPLTEVSAHYLIGRHGTVWQLVHEDKRAWHAGAGEWRGLGDVNSRSIGIELDNDGKQPFSHPLMIALEQLMPEIMLRWSIGPDGVIGHSDMAPDRKFDPGPRFDWNRLARQGLAVWPNPQDTMEPGDFFSDAVHFGYPNGPSQAVLAAFRSRFRPYATGPLSSVDRIAMRDLAERFGVDRNRQSA